MRKEDLKYLGLTQVQFADLIGCNDRTIRRYISGDIETPGSIMLLLDAWKKLKDCGLGFLPNSMDLDGFNGKLTASDIRRRIRII